MCALYAFMRIADDLTDCADSLEHKRSALARWRADWHAALAGEDRHPLHPALRDTVERYHIPRQYFEDVLDGVEQDLTVTRYGTFTDLYRYCYRVASAVGLACIHIWGFTGEAAYPHAEAAGIALQLTNILRDLGEDAKRGRVYLPLEDLARFGYPAESLRQGVCDEAFRALMEFQTTRAHSYYAAAEPLVGFLQPAGRAVFLLMLRTYRGLLDIIVRRNYDVFSQPVRLGRWHKLWLAVRVLPVRWGWTSGHASRGTQAMQQAANEVSR
jgi:phytoene synthase